MINFYKQIHKIIKISNIKPKTHFLLDPLCNGDTFDHTAMGNKNHMFKYPPSPYFKIDYVQVQIHFPYVQIQIHCP